jgi:FixJ family two-component response regulator
MVEWADVVAVVDDDSSVLNAIDALLSAHGYGRELYGSARAFLSDAVTSTASCAIIDVQLGSDNGIERGGPTF